VGEKAKQEQGPVVVIGLRSIGTSLAAVVAAVTRTGTPPLTLRPLGHPFRRRVQAGPRLEQLVFAQPQDTRFAIVDEGPGLSGSSFGAVADWLEDRGVAPERIHFFPGHGGSPGPEASPRHHNRWHKAARHVVAFEDFLLRDATPSWLAEEDSGTGGLALEDVAGDRWRARLYPTSEEGWPPANPPQERRKYLYQAQGRTWLARFAGLGRYGEWKLARGLSLTRAGLIPPVCGLRHGFLVGEWLSSARPVSLIGGRERKDLIEAGARYLGFLAREFSAGAEAPGASPATLWEMARLNTQERFGPALAVLLDRWREHLGALAGRLRRVWTDNRMHLWEWLRLPDGRILKADALDHHQGHDCIGAQDLAWDVVGAAVEWDLGAAEQEALDRQVQDLAPYRPDPLVKGFYLPCYLAFQMGYYEMAAAGLASSQPEEATRLRAAAERYASRLQQVLIGAS
jgi:hypothetical protein